MKENESAVKTVKGIKDPATGVSMDNLKYTKEQIDRLFTVGEPSVLARAAHIAAQHRKLAKAKHERKFIKEDGEAQEGDPADDGLEELIEGAANLMDKLLGPCDEIVQALEQVEADTIDALLDHLEDGGSFGDDDRVMTVMKSAIKGVTGR